MKINFNIKPTWHFYLFVAGVFLIIVSPNLFSHGMFMDGLIYSSVAKNMANGIGTFWNPHFTATFMPNFHEHPPLALGLQSIFFRLFGESRLVEKFYSLLMVLIVAIIISKIWKTLHYKYAWFPLLLWLSTPVVAWACCNNMLENTLTVFILLSVLFYLKSLQNKKHLFLFMSGFMLVLGFLTKGFVAFFPWTFPLIAWFLMRQKSFRMALADTAELVLFTVTPLILLIVFIPEARLSLKTYLDVQLINSLKNVVTVDTRFFILIRLCTELIPAFVLCFLFIAWGKFRKLPLNVLKSNHKQALVFILLGLSGVLPVMVSLKQSGFYILATYPIFAIGFSLLLYPLLETLFCNINYNSKGFLFFKIIAYVIFILGVTFSLSFSTKYNHEKNRIKDIYTIILQVPSGSIINIEPEMFPDWVSHGYFSRFKSISLDPELKNNREYLLVKNEIYSDTLERNYKIIPLNTTVYKLLKRK
jgi:4-amino-4-deoxy-L-arabinose transferase-like glycosyltransferase